MQLGGCMRVAGDVGLYTFLGFSFSNVPFGDIWNKSEQLLKSLNL